MLTPKLSAIKSSSCWHPSKAFPSSTPLTIQRLHQKTWTLFADRQLHDSNYVFYTAWRALNQGVSLTLSSFTPKIGKRTLWLLIFTMIEVLLAKFTENAVSNLNLGVIELISLVSYRFVSLSVVAILLVVTSLAFPFLRYIGLFYVLAVDTYFCVSFSLLRNFSWKIAVENGSKNREA